MSNKIFTIFALLFVFGTICSLSGQISKNDVPLVIKPIESLNDNESFIVKKSIQKFYKASPTPSEVYKRPPAPSRILNGDGFELINVSNAPDGQHENWIAINPLDPNNIIATSNDSRYLQAPPKGYRMVAFYSKDGAKTWKESTTDYNQDLYIDLTPQPWNMTIFDPGITFDSKGSAYYAYGFTETYEDFGTNQNGVFVCKSSDGGASWELPVPVVLELGSSNLPFHDRYMIVCDYNESSPYKDNLYIAWKRFVVDPAVLFSRSTDGGETWEPPIELKGGKKPSTQSATPLIGPDGLVYVVWEDPDRTTFQTDAVVQVSSDGGKTWRSSPIIAQTLYTVGTEMEGRYVLEDKQKIRVGSDPVMAADFSGGPRNGWLYVVQAGKIGSKDGPYGLYLARSTDGGKNWENLIRIDDNELQNDMFFPSITVDPTNGHVAIFYYSSQNDEDNVGVDGYLAYSTDGINFSNIRLTPETWYLDRPSKVSYQGSANNWYWGDYTSITAYNGIVYPLFWMPSPINGDFYSLELFTAKLSTAPRPPTDLAGKSDAGDQSKVILTWNDPKTSVLGTALDKFVIRIFRDGNEIGSVDNGVQTFTDAGLTSGLEYSYSIYAESSVGKSTPISATIYAGSNPEPNAPTNLTAHPSPNGVILTWMNPDKHIDGQDYKDEFKVNVYVDGTKATEVTNNIQAGLPGEILLDLPTEKFYYINISAVGKRGDLETESKLSNEVLAYSGAPLTEFSENFDGSSILPHITNSKWAITNEKSKSAPNCLADSPNENYEYGDFSIIFAPVVIDPTKTTLVFDFIALIKKGLSDVGEVAVSNDFGKSWNMLIWVDETYSDKFISGDLTNSEFEELGLDLSKWAGDTLYVKFRLFSNPISFDKGFFVDNLRISSEPVSVQDPNNIYSSLSMSVFPNPTINNTNLKVNLPISGNTRVSIHDSFGRTVNTLENSFQYAGQKEYFINTNNLASGTYFISTSLNGVVKTQTLIIKK